uniref:Uncharacterized protein n=1 Tax=Arundo donax TaxID=35708 RepID=A0A0A8ZVZ1_ARUDO
MIQKVSSWHQLVKRSDQIQLPQKEMNLSYCT